MNDFTQTWAGSCRLGAFPALPAQWFLPSKPIEPQDVVKPEDNAETLSNRPNQTLISTQTITHEYLTLSGKVARETVKKNGSVTDVMDFVYDESGRPFALIHQTDGVGITLCTYYYVLNLQGDVVKLVTASGDVVANYEYDAWGNILLQSGEMASINPLRYRGYYYDTETGFYYLQSRYYDPANRRFINADSYASTGQGFIGCNMFAYCRNSPSSRVDQTGDYDRDAAVEYADDWNEEPNEGEYEYFGGRGGDCANFVSQCLQAGGVELTDDWYYKRHAAFEKRKNFCRTDERIYLTEEFVDEVIYYQDEEFWERAIQTKQNYFSCLAPDADVTKNPYAIRHRAQLRALEDPVARLEYVAELEKKKAAQLAELRKKVPAAVQGKPSKIFLQ